MRYQIFVVVPGAFLALSSCGPTPKEIEATSTAIAAAIFSTQTAEAPTATSTPSPTPPPPTATPQPSPTSTSEIQPTPTLPPAIDGWRTYVTESYSLSLPEDWIAVDISTEGLAAIDKALELLDPELRASISGTLNADVMSNLMGL